MNTRRLIAIGLAAVATAAAATTSSTAAATAASAATAPAQHAYSQQDLQRDLDAITATGVPGVLAEVRTGDRQLRGTSGVANLDSRKPVNANGFFRIGSNTKTFISVACTTTPMTCRRGSPRPRRTASRTPPPAPPGTTPTPTTSSSG